MGNIDFTSPAQVRAANERIAIFEGWWYAPNRALPAWKDPFGNWTRTVPQYHTQPAELLRVLRKITEGKDRPRWHSDGEVSRKSGYLVEVRIVWGNQRLGAGTAPTFEQAAFSAIIQYLDREGGEA